MDGMRSSMQAYRSSRAGGASAARTEFDTPINYVLVVVLVSIVPLFLVFNFALAEYPGRVMISAIMTFLMLVFGFVFASVAGYMAGLVGSSNKPDLRRNHSDGHRLGTDPAAAHGQRRHGRDTRADRRHVPRRADLLGGGHRGR